VSRSDSGLCVGVVGVGYWGSKHLRVLTGMPGVGRVVAIDERLGSVPDLASGVADQDRFTSLARALPEVDAVVIATPPGTHAPLALAAIRAGKHVLVEKPMATTTADSLEMVEQARAHGVTLMVGHTFEHNAAVWALRDLVASGELGDLYYLDSSRLNLGLYQSDVNVVMDLAPHDISIANYVLDATPSAVTAWGARHVHSQLEDVAHLCLEYEALGVRANVHVSWLDPEKVRRVTAVGSKKMAVYNDMSVENRLVIHDKSAMATADGTRSTHPIAYHVGEVYAPQIDVPEPLKVQDSQFVGCVHAGSEPTTDGLRGLAVVRVLEAAQISLEQRRRVELDEIDGWEQSSTFPSRTIDLRDHVTAAAVVGS